MGGVFALPDFHGTCISTGHDKYEDPIKEKHHYFTCKDSLKLCRHQAISDGDAASRGI